MKRQQEEKTRLNMIGEFAVCVELLKRGIHAFVTYGNQKAADIITVGKDKRASVIEVKTSDSNRIVTGFFQKYYIENMVECPDFWVLVHFDSKTLQAEFYVLTHQEMGNEQMKRNNMSEWKFVNGVDNVSLKALLEYKGEWSKIQTVVG